MEKRNTSLDVIKIVATTIIVFHHYQYATGTQFNVFINFCGGPIEWYRLVELFFIISGMLSYRAYGNMKGFSSFFSFYKTKFVRLVPMVPISYIVFLGGGLIYWMLTHEQKFLGGGTVLRGGSGISLEVLSGFLWDGVRMGICVT